MAKELSKVEFLHWTTKNGNVVKMSISKWIGIIIAWCIGISLLSLIFWGTISSVKLLLSVF